MQGNFQVACLGFTGSKGDYFSNGHYFSNGSKWCGGCTAERLGAVIGGLLCRGQNLFRMFIGRLVEDWLRKVEVSLHVLSESPLL